MYICTCTFVLLFLLVYACIYCVYVFFFSSECDQPAYGRSGTSSCVSCGSLSVNVGTTVGFFVIYIVFLSLLVFFTYMENYANSENYIYLVENVQNAMKRRKAKSKATAVDSAAPSHDLKTAHTIDKYALNENNQGHGHVQGHDHDTARGEQAVHFEQGTCMCVCVRVCDDI